MSTVIQVRPRLRENPRCVEYDRVDAGKLLEEHEQDDDGERLPVHGVGQKLLQGDGAGSALEQGEEVRFFTWKKCFFRKLKCAQTKRLNSNFLDGDQAVCRQNKLFEHEKTRNQQMGEIKVFNKIPITGMARPASSGPP